jgi:hypothetical protein
VRVRALKAAPDTAGLYFLMKGFALHPFGEAKRGSSPAKPQFEIQKYPPDHSTIYANFKKDFSPNILKDPFKYAIIV